MNTRPEVISELRAMFRAGATPSRLIRLIVERHEGGRSIPSTIQAYFSEAFGVSIVRGLNPVDDYQHSDLRYAGLNEQLLHEMIQKRNIWDHNEVSSEFETESWLDSLEATDDKVRLSQLQASTIPELNRCWSLLTPKEQHFIQMSLASVNGQHETVKILSRLVEQLQQQLIELHVETSANV